MQCDKLLPLVALQHSCCHSIASKAPCFPMRARLPQQSDIREQVYLTLYRRLRDRSSPAHFMVLLEAGGYSSGSCAFGQAQPRPTCHSPRTQSPEPEGTFFMALRVPKARSFHSVLSPDLHVPRHSAAFETIIIRSDPCFTAWAVPHPLTQADTALPSFYCPSSPE